jgi:hypothetical protein
VSPAVGEVDQTLNHQALDVRAKDSTAHFLHLCLRGYWDPAALEEARTFAAQGDLSWPAFTQLVYSQRLAALLYHLVRGRALVPPEVESDLQQAHDTNIVRNTLLFHALEGVLHPMAAAGVSVILLKGAALSATIYDGTVVRAMGDLDLLVPRAKLDLAQAVLAELNWAIACLEPWAGFSLRYRNVLEYCRADDGDLPIHIDLHWGPISVPYYERIPTQDLFARAQTVRVGDAKALVPAPEDHLLCLCGQLALHDRYAPALFRYFDMAALIRAAGDAFDWEEVVQRSVEWRLVIPVQRTLAHLENLWPATVPRGVVEEAAKLRPAQGERWIHRWVVDCPQNPTSDVLLFLVTLPGLTRRVGYLLEQAFPSPSYMRRLYCPRQPGLWPLAYLQRAGLTLLYLLRSLSKPRTA